MADLYKQKLKDVYADQWDGSSSEVMSWLDSEGVEYIWDNPTLILKLKRSAGLVGVPVGHWIIKDTDLQFKVLSNEEFTAIFS